MGTPHLRRVIDDEWLGFSRFWASGFHEEFDEADVQGWRDVLPAQRCWTSVDEVGYVASSGAFPFRISVPGGTTLGCAGVTIVGVRTDHRRRGILRSMMERLHADAAANDEPVAALLASDGAIYGRFGYGAAEPRQTIRVRSVDVAGIGDATRARMVTAATWLDVAPRLAAAIGARRGGMLTLSAGHWEAMLYSPDKHPNRFAAVGEDAIVFYRTKDGPWDDRAADATLEVVRLLAIDDQAEADLWAHLGSVDLVTEITAHRCRSDDPLRWRVADEARVRDTSYMPVFIRLLDMPRALAARTYEVADRLVLRVHDASAPANDGTWSLDAGPDGCEVTATDDEADVELDVADLASLWLGGVSPAPLVAAGRIEVADPGVVGRLRRLFAVDLAPWTPFDF